MNLSGETAAAALGFYRAPPAAMLVAHDEVDLPAGVARLKHGGGSGGHRGLADISRRVGNDYWRLRIGVGKPAVGDVADYVLKAPPPDERAQIDDAMARALAVWQHIATGDFDAAMLNLHTVA